MSQDLGIAQRLREESKQGYNFITACDIVSDDSAEVVTMNHGNHKTKGEQLGDEEEVTGPNYSGGDNVTL